MSSKDTKFLFKFLGATMEAMNLKPESFVKIFWHLAYITAFIMCVRLAIKIIGAYFGVS